MGKGADGLLEGLAKRLEADGALRAELERKIKGLVVFKVDNATWTLDLRAGKGKLTKGEPPADEKADITLTMADAVFVGLVSGKTSAQQAFIMRKLKINGSMGLAARLQPILDAAAPKAKM